MRLRKNWLNLTNAERDTYLRAVITLKATIANPSAPVAQQYSIYDRFVLIHQSIQNLTTPLSGTPTDGAHGFFHFLPWHRKFVLEFENALNAAVPGQNIGVPYWDWPDTAGLWGEILVDNAFGPNGTGVNRVVSSGYFSPMGPAVTPAWWPVGFTGWQNRFHAGLGADLVRNIDSMLALPNMAIVQNILQQGAYFSYGNISNPATYSGMWWVLEGGPHAEGHNWFSGAATGGADPFAHMSHMYVSVNDPMFFLHHSNVDRLWAMWQIDGHSGAGSYGAPGIVTPSNYGHSTAHLLFPWVGSATGFSSPTTTNPTIDYPDLSAAPATNIGDMLDHRGLGYAYDTEPVVGLALDRSGSMTGVTPDPMTGMPSTLTKWEVASQGISNFLLDCQTARAAGEAIVTAGVETFRNTGGANEFAKLFSPATGVVRPGSNASQTAFNTAIAGMTPSGGTPIAGALTDTETALVRAPYGGNPANGLRYLCILTDGKETAPPDLVTLGNPAYPNTVIFAMGFGVGNGWNGVDYGTILTITQKGGAAPVGVNQVHHGESINVVNKFYTNGVAHAIGYDPIIDPIIELNAGQFGTVPFTAGPEDRSFMIVVNGFVTGESEWIYYLLGPNGNHYSDGDPGPFAITLGRGGGRMTLFLNRNGAKDSEWHGQWFLVLGYKMARLPEDFKTIRAGMNTVDLLTPSGASRPLEGPRFSLTKGAQRPKPMPRMLVMTSHHLALAHLNMAETSDRITVAVNIYTKTSMPAALSAAPSAPYAGADILWNLDLDRYHRRRFENIRVVAQLVRPNFHLGDAYRDPETIPVKERVAFIDRKTKTFDEVAFLAEYERRRPGAFAYVEEALAFKQVNETQFVAKSLDTGFPGVYRLGLMASGRYSHPGSEQHQSFQRILNADTSLGLKLDSERSKPTWHWTGERTADILVTPQDRFGHYASPARMPDPVLVVNGRPVASEHINDFSGTHLLRITLASKVAGFLNDTGDAVIKKGVKLAALEGQPLEFALRESFNAYIQIGTQRLNVMVPQFVARANGTTVLAAGDAKALAIEPKDRLVFRDLKDALGAGLKVEGEEDSKE